MEKNSAIRKRIQFNSELRPENHSFIEQTLQVAMLPEIWQFLGNVEVLWVDMDQFYGYRRTVETDGVLVEAVRLCYKHQHLSDEYMANRIAAWWEDEANQFEKIGLRRSTYNNLRTLGRVPRTEITARAIYAFFSVGPQDFRYIAPQGLLGAVETEADRFADVLLRWAQPSAELKYQSLAGLVGMYESYRPSWKVGGDGEQMTHIIRSHVTIEQKGIAYWLREQQSFNVAEHHFSETDEGPIMPFALSIMCLSKSTDQGCMKLYSLYSTDPAPSEKRATNSIKGSVMAISNKGPHWAGPIMLRRISAIPRECAHLTVEELYCQRGGKAILDFLRSPDIDNRRFGKNGEILR
ncbi:hypothetical protein V6617_01285 [Pelagibacterium nitratireducens]|uniref:Uncharacterized protein n=1 Tax=Pelagibacterium nitratireducens TaxID=1046114 RepID=A0ABZ2HZW9_9HYPH